LEVGDKVIAEFKSLYRNSPSWLRQMVRLIPFNYRLGRRYRATLRFLNDSDAWNQHQYREYQRQQLALLLTSALNHVPHYQRYRHLLGRDPFDILRQIEPVTKRQMQDDPDRFLMPPARRRGHHLTYTGGSSGTPLTIPLDNSALEIEWAFMIALWSRVGYRPGDSRISFRTTDLIENADDPVVANPIFNEILCSPANLTEERLSAYVALIRRFRPKCIRGYPSVLTALARYIEDQQVTALPPIQALLCASEEINPSQRTFLERTFHTRTYSWYGMSEKVVLAGECEQSHDYHCFPQYGITEVIDSSGNVSSQPGIGGEIVGTGFLNHVLPFIRYRLDDYTTITGDYCSACGRWNTMLSPVRGHHYQGDLIGKSGVRISMTAINVHDDSFRGVRQYQFHQRESGSVNVYLCVTSGFDDERRRLVWKSLTQRTGNEIDYHIQLVDRIEQTGLGKGIYLRQELPDAGTNTVATNLMKERPDEDTRLD
jgi:phenylacetate-CoA ligase